MSVVELDISTSPEALFRVVSGAGGSCWIDGRAAGGATFMAFAPVAQLVVHGDGAIERRDPGSNDRVRGDALSAIDDFVAATSWPDACDAPHTAGFLGYDLAALIEPRIRPRRDATAVLPLAQLLRYDAVIELTPRDVSSAERGWRPRIHARSDAAAARCASTLHRMMRDAASITVRSDEVAPAGDARLLEVPRRDVHVRAVRRALDYIAAGDVYQINLAQRFRVASAESPAEVFLRMCAAQPVPHATYLDCGSFAVLCASPERFLRVRGRDVETEPIKGTRRSDADPARDAALRAALAADPKERAEHVMIVDLERNDLGRACTTGSVAVPSLMRTESFATLHHLVSTVRGTLRDDVDLASVLRATFPGGSITGAPKIRAAQIIAELEAQPREVYTGAVAWFRAPRDLDSAIAIRTAIASGGTYTYHAGGGIVADSDPDREYDECLLKAAPFLRALRISSDALARACDEGSASSDDVAPRASLRKRA